MGQANLIEGSRHEKKTRDARDPSLAQDDTKGTALAMNYDDEWRKLRKRRRRFWFVFLGWAPLCALVAVILDAISPGLGSTKRSFLFMVIPLMVANFVVFLDLMTSACPRCRKLYFGGLGGMLGKRCAHCGLRLWTSENQISN